MRVKRRRRMKQRSKQCRALIRIVRFEKGVVVGAAHIKCLKSMHFVVQRP